MTRSTTTTHLLFCLFTFALVNPFSSAFAQEKKFNFVAIGRTDTKSEIITKAANVVPTTEQYEWQKMECIAFVHFGMNTFTETQIGSGHADPNLFDPTGLDCDQWARVLKNAGMKMAILTAKHHDGFCLWPSRFTDYSVKSSRWKNGKGDVVKEFVDACRKYGLKVGLYLSPWDRNNTAYGTPAYNTYLMNQLRELLSNYGKISEVWFDGYRGPGAKPESYHWHGYYRLIRQLQPDALIAVMGPDVRWVGTESGYGRETEWDVIPLDVNGENISKEEDGDHPLDSIFIPRNYMGDDLGSRDSLYSASALFWYPAETDVSIRPGWFYDSSQDTSVKSVDQLVDIYFNSVGKNSVLLLNVPADKRGLISDYDIKALDGFHRVLKKTFSVNLSSDAIVRHGGEKEMKYAKLFGDHRFWSGPDNTDTSSLEFDLKGEKTFDVMMLQEEITVGQRIEKFHIDYWNEGGWKKLTEGTTVGYKRLLRFKPVKTSRVRLVIESSRLNPTLANFGLYMLPERYVQFSHSE